MKKILSVIVFLMTISSSFAQQDVTQFLGIPIDGTKSEMIAKLKAKEFVSSDFDKEVLTGEFNGRDVNLYVVTNNNKVYRIMVADNNLSDEANIKIRYNNLCDQFENNPKYIPTGDYKIADDIDISYEISIHDNQFQACYYQKPTNEAFPTEALEALKQKLLVKYTEEELQNPNEELKEYIVNEAEKLTFDYYSKKSVWFIISEYSYNKYGIVIYYDNAYNRANGEDL